MSQELRIVFILPTKGTKDHEMYEVVREGDGMWLMLEFFEYWVAQRHLPNWDMACTSGSAAVLR
jgi:hypothetical protein